MLVLCLYLRILCNSAFIHVNLLQFELPEDTRSRVKKISVIRNLCLKVHHDDLQFSQFMFFFFVNS